MQPLLDVLWQQGALVIALVIVLYTGHKGYWYWSPGVTALATELARQRDDWRSLAVTLMRAQGINLPEGFEKPSPMVLPGENGNRKNTR